MLQCVNAYLTILNSTFQEKNKKMFGIIDMAFREKVNDKETVEYLKIEHSRVPVFYALPKVHKLISGPPVLWGWDHST